MVVGVARVVGIARVVTVVRVVGIVRVVKAVIVSELGPLHMEVGDPGEMRYLNWRGKEILVFTWNPGDAG